MAVGKKTSPGYLLLRFSLVREGIANARRQYKVNGVNFGKEVKAVPLWMDNMILYLENSGGLTKKKISSNSFF